VSVGIGRVCVDELVKYLRSKYSRADCVCGLAGASKYLRSKYSRAGGACLPEGRSVALRERAIGKLFVRLAFYE
jgi:hypothetical protein